MLALNTKVNTDYIVSTFIYSKKKC